MRSVYNRAVMNGPARLLLTVTFGSALLTGCSVGPSPATPQPTAAATVVLQVEPALAPTEAPIPLPPTSTAFCVNDAQFMEDLTLPDGTEVLPGAALDKRWLVLNRGECAWGPEHRLVQIGDSRIEGPGALALYPAVAGGQAVWQVQLTAPQEEGEFISRWRAQAPDGTLFGDEVYVLVVVDASPLTPTPIPTAASP
ncbi:MAG: NBR1-Ig-like domain-containing protein [Chloroflexi bacterium]|nr:NBR1-Ig-like domain-containing protein [Chloroflexota bacterium]